MTETSPNEYAAQRTTELHPLPKQVCCTTAENVALLLQEEGTRRHFADHITRLCSMAEECADHVQKCLDDPKLKIDWKPSYEKRSKLQEEINALWSERDAAEEKGDQQGIARIDKEILEKAKQQEELLAKENTPPEPECKIINLSDNEWQFFELTVPWPSGFVRGSRWIRPGAANPLLWFEIFPYLAIPTLNPDECRMHDCFLLATIHGQVFHNPKDRPSVSFSYEPIFPEPYSGNRFKRDKFRAKLWKHYYSDKGLIALTTAFGRVKSYLDELPKPQPPAVETQGDEAASGQRWEVPWDQTDNSYMESGKARVDYTDNKTSATKLSKSLGEIPVHFMRKAGKGARVHIGEFRAWAKKEYPDAASIFESEAAQEHLADIEARKATERAKGRRK